MGFIILPQAINYVIPGIVGNFISLFKDTSLVSIIGLFDLLNTVAVCHRRPGLAFAQPLPSPAYVFAGAACSGSSASRMSRYSQLHSSDRLRHRAQIGIRDDQQISPTRPAPSTNQKMKVSQTDVAIDIVGMQQMVRRLPRAARHQPRVMKGERIVIAGPSGSGKSTLIRCINRLEEHQKGKIVVDGDRAHQRPQAHRRGARAKSAWCSSTSTCSRI